MIPHKTRRVIEDILETYGKDIPMVMDEKAPLDSLYLLGKYGEPVALHGSVRAINWARDIRDSSFVPEIYSDEATTWA